MGYIAEPKGVDFIVAPTVFTDADEKIVRQTIATYKKKSDSSANQERVSSTSVAANGNDSNQF